METDSYKKLLTTKELAALLRHRPLALELWRKNNLGPPYYKLNKKVYYREEDVVKWLEGNRKLG